MTKPANSGPGGEPGRPTYIRCPACGGRMIEKDDDHFGCLECPCWGRYIRDLQDWHPQPSEAADRPVERVVTEGEIEGPGHTPGPWKIENGEIIAVGPDGNGAAVLGVIYGAEDYPCCDEDIDAECKANGDLIAAAPDLFAACELFMRWDESPHNTERDAVQLRRVMAAAICKATGPA